MKKLILILLVIFAVIPINLKSVNAVDLNEISVFLNGNRLYFDLSPIIVDGSTLVPMRKIFEELSYTVDWNETKKRVTVVKGNSSIQLDIGDKLAILNNYDSAVELDVPAQIIAGSTMVPLRFVASVSGCDVIWDAVHNTVHIKNSATSENVKPNQVIATNSNIIYNSGYRFAFDGSIFEESVAAKSKSLQIYNDKLYYLNSDGFLCAESIDSKKTDVIISQSVKSPLIIDDKIYYINPDNDFLYQAGLDGVGGHIVVKEPFGEYIVIREKIYYKRLDNSNLKEYSLDTGETVTIYDGNATCFDIRYVPGNSEGSADGWYQVYYCDDVKGDGIRFFDKYDYRGVIVENIHADKLWVCGEDLIYRTANGNGTYDLFRYGKSEVNSYNIKIASNILGDVEQHNGKIFYFAEGVTTTRKVSEWFMARADGTNPIPIMFFAFSNLSYSQIDGNIPENEHFDEYLKRDITHYFGDKSRVEYILLRKSPSQTGLSYPRYYAWVTVSDENGNVELEGAVRLSAMEKEGFAVTDFITKKQILEDSSVVERIFPLILKKRILELVAL